MSSPETKPTIAQLREALETMQFDDCDYADYDGSIVMLGAALTELEKLRKDYNELNLMYLGEIGRDIRDEAMRLYEQREALKDELEALKARYSPENKMKSECSVCGVLDESVKERLDPYMLEIHDKERWIASCRDCYQKRVDDI